MEGDIIRCLTLGELEDILNHLITGRVIDEEDKDDILGMNRQKGATHLFTVMHDEWPIKFFCALEQVKPELLRKIDPLGESPCKSNALLDCLPQPVSVCLLSVSLSLCLSISVCLPICCLTRLLCVWVCMCTRVCVRA